MDPSAGAPPPQGSAPPYGAPQPGMYPPQQPGMYPPQQGAPQQPYGAPSPYPPQGAPSPYPQQGAPSPYPQQGAPSPYPPGAMPPQGAPYGYPHQQSQPQFAPPPVVVQVVMPAVPGQIPPPQLGPISGYENVPPSVDKALSLSAPFFLPPGPPEPAAMPIPVTYPAMNDTVAREAMRAYCKAHLTYSKDPAIGMTIGSVTPGVVYRVQLDTFMENRSVQWVIDSFPGGTPVDGPEHGPPPPVWDINAAAVYGGPFVNKAAHIEVPHTATVKPCHECQMQGRLPCGQCQSQGFRICTNCDMQGNQGACFFCNGSGFDNGRSCFHCNGSGRTRCTMCQGTRRIKCGTCEGQGTIVCKLCKATRYIKIFLRCNVTWVTKTDIVGIEYPPVPPKDMEKAVGKVVLLDERTVVFPPSSMDPRAVAIAQDLISKHHNPASAPTSRVLRQKLAVTEIPVATITATFKKHTFSYWTYGVDNKVFETEYPGKPNCSVM